MQGIPVGANPRSSALDAAGRLLVVGTRGGVEVFAVTANGGLSVAARAGGKLPPELATLDADCVALVQKVWIRVD